MNRRKFSSLLAMTCAVPYLHGCEAKASFEGLQQNLTGVRIGVDTAPVKRFVFFDAMCPHCAALWSQFMAMAPLTPVLWAPVAFLAPASLAHGVEILSSKNPVEAMTGHANKFLSKSWLPSTPSLREGEWAEAIRRNTQIFTRAGGEFVPLPVAMTKVGGYQASQRPLSSPAEISDWLRD